MNSPVDIVAVARIAGCGIVVTFSDGTSAAYPSEELEALRPYREPAPSIAPQTLAFKWCFHWLSSR
jgi:hypothetical protein